jgi:hypothetical protein
MTPLLIALPILAAALLAFFATTARPVAGFLFGAATLLLGLGLITLVEKGPQAKLAHLPFSPSHLAWGAAALALGGFGIALGSLLRSLLRLLAQRFKK